MKYQRMIGMAFLLLSASMLNLGFCQTEWSLKKDKDGIKVYTGKMPDSKFNAIRVSCQLKGNLSS